MLIFKKMKRYIKQIFMSLVFLGILIGGWVYPLLGYFIPLCMFLGIGISFFQGRKWCDWYCPRGSFYDALVKPFSPKKQIPKLFKRQPFRIIVLAILMSVMTTRLIFSWPNPYKIGAFFILMLSVTTTLGIILTLFFHQRTWCYLCPVGFLANLAGRGKHPLKIDSSACIDCKLCAKVCPMQIEPYKFKKEKPEIVQDWDCLKCKTCVINCPKKALKF
ncbi:MAG: 4Fe-4S binding protein [Candidatus Omnitrophica bacterium]|nr:4Fe-4S binding protein [Candidatus Omnitrophota bacterium]